MRNKMTNIPDNFSTKSEIKCICGQIEKMEHIYNCKFLDSEEQKIKYENIYQGNVNNLKSIVKRFEQNMNKREKNCHVIQKCDPPVFVVNGTGNG